MEPSRIRDLAETKQGNFDLKFYPHARFLSDTLTKNLRQNYGMPSQVNESDRI